MIDGKDLFHFVHYEYGEAFFGSYKGMRYRVAREPLVNVHFKSPEDKAKGTIKAEVWPEPYGYAAMAAEEKTCREFAFSEEGLEQAVAWLNEQYECGSWKAK